MGSLADIANKAFTKVDETKTQLTEATQKVEMVIKLNVILIAVVSVLVIILAFQLFRK